MFYSQKMKFKKKNFIVNLLTGKSVIGITLTPFGIYLRKDRFYDKVLRNHESIHWKQQMEMLILPFYLWYLIEWFIRLFMKGDAYRNISFEREAFYYQRDENYLSKRKKFTWLKFLKNN